MVRPCDCARLYLRSHPFLVFLLILRELCHTFSLCQDIFNLNESKIKDYLFQSIRTLFVLESSDPPQPIMHATTDFAATSITTPLQGSGSLDQFKSWEVTPCIGTEFQDVDLSEWITASDSDTLLKDLAILSTNPPYFRQQNGILQLACKLTRYR